MGGLGPNPDLDLRIQNDRSRPVSPARLREPVVEVGLDLIGGPVICARTFAIEN